MKQQNGETVAGNPPEQNRLVKRRRYEARGRMKEHGAGLPSSLAPLEAIRVGECPLCSDHVDALHLHILVHFPNLSRKEARLAFLRKLNLPEDTPVVTDRMRQRWHDGKALHPVSKETRAKIAERATGNQNHLADVPNWPLMRLIARGKTPEGVYGLLKESLKLDGKLGPHAIGDRARDRGFKFRTTVLCDQCEPFTYGRIFHLRRVSGFEVADFDKCVGLDEGRSGSTVPEDRIVDPGEARKVIAWRDDVLTTLLNIRPLLTVAGKEYRKDEVLLTFLPEIVETNRALLASMREIRQDAWDHREWGIEELCEAVCRAAAFEESIEGNPDHSRRKTLRYICEEKSEAWLAENVARLRGNEHNGQLVRDLVGHRYSATQQTVQNAITERPRTQAIAPEMIWALIKRYAPAAAEAKNYGGRPPGSTKETKETVWYEVGRMVEEKIKTLLPIFEEKMKLSRDDRRKWSTCGTALEKRGYGPAESQAVAGNKDATVAARQLVGDERHLDYDTVATYHKRYRRHLRSLASSA